MALGADWPRLGGPSAAGISPEKGLATRWADAGPAVLWTVDLAEGYGGAAVHSGEVFVLDRIHDQTDVLRCLELESGKELWRLESDTPGKLPYNGSRNVPTVDRESLYTVSPFGEFRCIDRATHKVRWSKHLVNDFKDPEVDVSDSPKNREEELLRAQVPRWGVTQAPLLYHGLVIVAPQTQKVGLVAYDRVTGEIRWRSGYIGRNWFGHVSPTLMKLGGTEQVIMLAQPSDPEKSPADAPPSIISSVDPETGRVLWTTRSPVPHKIPITQPLQLDDRRLFIASGLGFGCMILQVEKQGDGWKTEVTLQNRQVAGHIHSPVLYENRIYLTSFRDQGGSTSGFVCLDLAGKLIWQTGPDLQFESGGFLVADGKAFVMHGKRGELYLLGLAAEKPAVLGQAKVLAAEDGGVWAPMALSNGRLLVRDQHQMKCLDMRGQGVEKKTLP